MKKYRHKAGITPAEKPAVETTIVGGRPPGSGKEVDSVPHGIEILVKKASVDPDFKRALLQERAAAAHRINLALKDSEVVMLNNIPQSHLEGIISATKVNPNFRKAFLGYSAAVMLAALTAATIFSKDIYGEVNRGISPDETKPDIVNIYGNPPFFRKAKSDAKLETGILKVKVIDRSNDAPLKSIKIYFIKMADFEKTLQNRTEGMGYTSASGVYRIKGIPEGEYSMEVARDSDYFIQLKKIEINANIENSIEFKLDLKNDAVTKGIRVDY